MPDFFLSTHMKVCLSLILLLLALLKPAYSQNENFKSEFGFRSDNDAYLAIAQDQYYTNGIFINFRHALSQKNIQKKIVKRIWEAEAGQYLYNPHTGSINTIAEIDRPFAAYLYGGGKLTWFSKDEQTFELGLNIGTIGPNARGEEVQKSLHKVVGFYSIKGWQYQITNEAGFNTSFKYSRLLSRKKPNNDLSLNTYLNIGNTFSGAAAGILFRAGRINNFFNSVSNNSRISNSIGDTIPKNEFFFFTRPMLKLTAYDATLQGGLFTHNKGPVTLSPNRFQYSQELGMNYATKRWTLNVFVTFESKESKIQERGHQYGSAIVYYRF